MAVAAPVRPRRDTTSKVLWGVMAFFAIGVAAYAVFVTVVPGAGAPLVRLRLATIPAAVYGHLLASALALALGPFQLNAKLRSRRLSLHRLMGRVYIGSVLVGGASSFVLAIHADGGLPGKFGFGSLALLWVLTAVLAYLRIRARNQVDHRRWMIRNYSLTFAAVTLRIWLPLALISGLPFDQAYPTIAWFAWVPNLIVAEWWLLRGPVRRELAIGAVTPKPSAGDRA